MKIFWSILGIIVVGVIIYRVWFYDNYTLQEYAGRAAIDVAKETAVSVVTDAIATKNENLMIAAKLRINELESQLAAEQEQARMYEAESTEWHETERLFRREIDELKDKNSIQWDYINSIPKTTSITNPVDCMPRTAAVYDWVSSGSYRIDDHSLDLQETGN